MECACPKAWVLCFLTLKERYVNGIQMFESLVCVAYVLVYMSIVFMNDERFGVFVICEAMLLRVCEWVTSGGKMGQKNGPVIGVRCCKTKGKNTQARRTTQYTGSIDRLIKNGKNGPRKWPYYRDPLL